MSLFNQFQNSIDFLILIKQQNQFNNKVQNQLYIYNILIDYNNLEPIQQSLPQQMSSLNDYIKSSISQFLQKSPSDQQLRTYLSSLLQSQFPLISFNSIQPTSIKQPILVHISLMVQDIRQNFYTYPFIISRPFNTNSKIWNFKFGQQSTQFNVDYIQNQNYFSYLTDRQSIYCMPVLYETQWVKDVQKNIMKENKIYQMIINQLNLFKLGEVFSAVCVYEPDTELLHFVRKANQQEINKFQNIHEYLNKPINNPIQVKQRLLKKLSQVYSQKYSQFVLFTMLSTSHLFISSTFSHISLFKKLLPRVCQLKITFPFKQSLFPYKKQSQFDQQILIRTPLQLSNQFTFVVIDFSNFSNQKQVKIQNEQIDNLKALKVFVQDGNTIYRWLYGESLIEHNHVGMVVKAASIINPQYVILQEETNKQKEKQKQKQKQKEKEKQKQNNNKIQQQQQQIKQKNQPIHPPLKYFQQFASQQLHQYRRYIHQMRQLNPIVKSHLPLIKQKMQSQSLQSQSLQQQQNNNKIKMKFDQLSLVKVMQLAKLNARSNGLDQIKLNDYQYACKLFFGGL